jgi:hypothetical protein|tara:strand:- start:542 stop:655 length:114 start_codon:yes stop_codon:yes gene_type:complete
MKYYIDKIKLQIEVFCVDHPLFVAFSLGFILGGLIFS